MEKAKKYLSIGFLILCLVGASFLIYKAFFDKSSVKLPEESDTGASETAVVLPTKTPEEIEIISSAKTTIIDITDTKIEPVVLEVKAFDQVQFNNKSGKTIKVVGEGWGNFPLPAGSNMTQPFNKAGKYNYKITGLDTSLTGKIIAE